MVSLPLLWKSISLRSLICLFPPMTSTFEIVTIILMTEPNSSLKFEQNLSNNTHHYAHTDRIFKECLFASRLPLERIRLWQIFRATAADVRASVLFHVDIDVVKYLGCCIIVGAQTKKRQIKWEGSQWCWWWWRGLQRTTAFLKQ